MAESYLAAKISQFVNPAKKKKPLYRIWMPVYTMVKKEDLSGVYPFSVASASSFKWQSPLIEPAEVNYSTARCHLYLVTACYLPRGRYLSNVKLPFSFLFLQFADD